MEICSDLVTGIFLHLWKTITDKEQKDRLQALQSGKWI